LAIKEDANKGIYIKDLTTVIVKSVAETERAMLAGLKNRKTGETAMNKDSSRSHSLFTIYIETAEDANVSVKVYLNLNYRMVQGNKRLKLAN
jgi:Kinesin motor domain